MSLFKKKELAVTEKKELIPPVTEQTITDYMKAFGIAGNLKDNEVEAFKQMAVMHNLNPFNREIYCSAYGSGDYRTLSIVTGYEVYIRKAEQSGLMEYWVVEEAPPETPVEKYYATLIIKRTDKAKEQTWTTHYSEAVQKKKNGEINAFWKKQPRMMTKKVAMSQGFRLFFEDVMHGIPYTREEMPEEKGGMTDVTPEPKPQPPKAKSIREEYEVEKEKVIEEIKEQSEPEVPDNDPEPVTDKPQQSGVQISDIVKIVNTSTAIPNDKKPGIMLRALPNKENPEELAKIMTEMKKEYGV